MPRLNIEDDIESHEEFWQLFTILKDRDLCLGKLVRWFRLSQKHYGHGRAVPEQEIESQGLRCMIESGWAVPYGDGYHALGADYHFGWYQERVSAASAGGKASARIRKEKYGTAQPPNQNPEANPNQPRSKSKQIEATPNPLSLTLSHSLNTKELKGADSRESPPKPVATPGKDVARVVAAYVEAWQERHSKNARPDLKPKNLRVIKDLLKQHSVERACDLVTAYCQMRDPWFETKKHDLITLESNLNVVSVALAEGTDSKVNWGKFWEKANGKTDLPGGDGAPDADVRGAKLPAGAT